MKMLSNNVPPMAVDLIHISILDSSCVKIIQLALRKSVLLLKCLFVPEIMYSIQRGI
jgi:hypothetical protein